MSDTANPGAGPHWPQSPAPASRLRSIWQQSRPAFVGLLVNPEMPEPALGWVEALAGKHGYHVHRVPTTSPGAALNAGLHDATADFMVALEAGDELEPSAVATIEALFEASPDAALALVGMRLLGPGLSSTVTVPCEATREALAAEPDAAHTSTPFRRIELERVGAFDESVAGLEAADAALRLLRAGGVGLSASDGLVRRRVELRHARPDLRIGRLGILGEFLGRHADLLTADPAAVLRKREDRIRALGARYRAVRDTREARLQEMAELREANAKALSSLSEAGRGIDFGDLHRTSPWSRNWGYERGVPVDRYYIERFLQAHAEDIHGRVLEVQEADYTRRFGADRVSQSDVLDLEASNVRANVIGDLRDAPNIPDETYDCIILTQTLHVIDDMERVVAECARILKPGGVLLATFPAASRVCLEYGCDGDFWRLTAAGARRLFESAFAAEALAIEAHGNVLATTAFLYGLGLDELRTTDLEVDDPFNPTLVTVRAGRPGGGGERGPNVRHQAAGGAVILLYHRVADARSDIHQLCMSPADFDRQMQYLADHCSPMSIGELRDALASRELPPRAVVVTFDDGYVDTLTAAAQVLGRYGIPATVFMTTAALQDPSVFRYWWDVLEWAVMVEPRERAMVRLPDGLRLYSLESAKARSAAHHAIHGALVPLDAPARQAALASLLDGRSPVEWLPRRMNLAELRALADLPGITIGAHGVDHLALPAHSAASQCAEIENSRRTLEWAIARQVRSFAYPFGSWSEDAAAAAGAAGMDLAFTCDYGTVTPDRNRLSLPRLTVAPATTQAFMANLERTFAAGASQPDRSNT